MGAALTARETPETTGPVRRSEHFPGFESLRALAAAMVVVHHAVALAGPTRAGRLATPAAVMDGGVAVFFVLSGFLIYRPFVAAHLDDRRGPAWRSFWWRRVLRIVPAYWVALTFFWVAGAYDLGPQWWRYYLFLQIYSPGTALGGIVQAWSLCTEMTFYLLIPMWVALVVRVGRSVAVRRRPVVHLAACATVWLAGVASRVAVERWAPSRRALSFNWLPTNLDLFATGMALAALSAWAVRDGRLGTRLDRLARSVWPFWLGAAVVFSLYAYRVGAADFATGYEGWFWHRRQFAMEAFSVLLLLPAVFGDQARGVVRHGWSAAPWVWLGSVSYGLYLWHFDWMKRAVSVPGKDGWEPVFVGDVNLGYLLAVGFGLGLVCAAMSWYLLERPLQRFKDLFPAPDQPGALGWSNRAR